MLFNKPIYDKIFFELAEHKDHSIQTLHTVISKKEEISLPNFYKIIDYMIKYQMLSKEKWKLALHTSWILWLLNLWEKIKKNYFEESSITIDLKEGEQKIFHASSLWDLDNVRANLLNVVWLKYEKDEPYYFYNAHTYHILGMQETEGTNFGYYNKQKQKVYFLTGNETVLDKYGIDLLRVQWTDAICNAKTKLLKDGYCVNIIWEYVIEVVFPPMITNYFKVFFDNTKNVREFNPELFQNIFSMKSDCKLSIRHNKKDAEMFKKEIMKYFGGNKSVS